MSISVKRTLWLASAGRGSGHTPYLSLFDDCIPLMGMPPGKEVGPQDAIFFDGGTDIQSSLYKEAPHLANEQPDHIRDAIEVSAFQRWSKNAPLMIGTCRGAQLLCALSGGKLIQHVTGHYGGHNLVLDTGEIVPTESSHHQMMYPGEAKHALLGWADAIGRTFEIFDDYQKPQDPHKLAEIVYFPETRSLCVQGHAEWTPAGSRLREVVLRLAKQVITLHN